MKKKVSVASFGSLLASLVCIAIGLLVGFIVLLVLGAITTAQSGGA